MSHGVGSLGRAHSISQIYIRGAGEPDDVARSGLLDLGAVEPLRDVKVRTGRGVRRDYLPVSLLVILPARVRAQDFVALFQRSLENPAAADAPEVLAPRERADLHKERLVHLGLRRGHALDYRVEQVVHAGLRIFLALRKVVDEPALEPRAVKHREVALLLRRAELDEQVEGLVERSRGVGVRAVYLIYDDYRTQAELQRAHKHVARLRHRPLVRVDEQQHRINHRKHALDLAREIRVARRVDDVDFVTAPLDGAVLCLNRDSALALDVARVHNALLHHLVVAEEVRRLENAVDERRLAVVYVRYNRYIAYLRRVLHPTNSSHSICPQALILSRRFC